VQEAHQPQGQPVQEGQGVEEGARSSSLRSETEGIWRPVEADFPKEGQNNEEDRAASRVHRLQAPQAAGAQAVQALRAGRRQEDQRPDDPVLSSVLFAAVVPVVCLFG